MAANQSINTMKSPRDNKKQKAKQISVPIKINGYRRERLNSAELVEEGFMSSKIKNSNKYFDINHRSNSPDYKTRHNDKV